MAVPPNEVEICLGVCGLDNPKIEAIRGQGIDSLPDFNIFPSMDDIKAMLVRITKLTAARGGAKITTIQIYKVLALAFWVRDRIRREIPIVATDFDAAALNDAVTAFKAETNEQDIKSDVRPPPKFKPEDWVEYENRLTNYLGTLKGVTGIPLNYVIRDEDDPDRDDESIIYQARLDGNTFKSDSERVFTIIHSTMVGTDGYEWMKSTIRYKDGRRSMLALRHHYDGNDQKEKRVQAARSRINSLHYRNEHAFSFELYSTKMKAAFIDLERYDHPGPTMKERINIFLNGIHSTNSEIRQTIRHIKLCPNTYRTFEEVVAAIGSTVTDVYQEQSVKKNTSRNVSRMEAHGRGPRQYGPGRFRGRGRGRYGRGGRGRGSVGNRGYSPTKYCNGVDISDLDRYYQQDELNKLPKVVRDSIMNSEGRRERRRKREIDQVSVQSEISTLVVNGNARGVADATESRTKKEIE